MRCAVLEMRTSFLRLLLEMLEEERKRKQRRKFMEETHANASNEDKNACTNTFVSSYAKMEERKSRESI